MQENILISDLTTMRLGGRARYVQNIEKVEQIEVAYDFAREKGVPVFVLGGGSNVIGRDEGYEGLILVSRLRGIEVVAESDDDVVVKAYSGERMDDVCKFAVEHGCSGIESLSGIPGTIGAAPVQNIGAYGQEISDVLDSVEVYDSVERVVRTLSKDECKMSYRKSVFNTDERGRYFIIAVTIRLKRKQLVEVTYRSLEEYLKNSGVTVLNAKNVREAVLKIREDKLPDERTTASAGSFFKNVVVSEREAERLREEFPEMPVFCKDGQCKIAAGWLIENAGLKGREFHGMRVSEKAALVLINESAKTYADLGKARAEITEIVKEKFGLELEQEPVELR